MPEDKDKNKRIRVVTEISEETRESFKKATERMGLVQESEALRVAIQEFIHNHSGQE